MHAPNVFILAIALAGCCISPCAGQCERQRHQSDHPVPEDWFGSTVAISGDFAAAGLYRDGTNGHWSGAVLMYRRDPLSNSWSQVQRIVPNDNQDGDMFGSRLVMDGDTLVVAARADDDAGPGVGSLYVYQLDSSSGTFDLKQKILGLTGGHDLGGCLSLSGDVLVAGVGTLTQAQVSVFRRGVEGWTLETTLQSDQRGAQYGYSVGTDGDTILVGGRSADYALPSYAEWIDVFERPSATEGWQKVQELRNPTAHGYTDFGITLAIDNGLALIASVRFAPPQQWVGGHVFRRNHATGHWEFEQQIEASEVRYWWVVRWMDIEEDTAIVGVTSPAGDGHGMVSVFRRSESGPPWQRLGDLGPSMNRAPANRYGFAVDINSNRVILGAPEYDYQSGVDGPGSVYVIEIAPDCNHTILCDDLDIAAGISLDANGNGIPDECETVAGDATGDGQVDIDDLIAVILAWGPCAPAPAPCPADVAPAAGDQRVDVDDLLAVILHWGR